VLPYVGLVRTFTRDVNTRVLCRTLLPRTILTGTRIISTFVDLMLKVKYLGLYLIGGAANFKIDLTVAKRKYYGSFISDLWLDVN